MLEADWLGSLMIEDPHQSIRRVGFDWCGVCCFLPVFLFGEKKNKNGAKATKPHTSFEISQTRLEAQIYKLTGGCLGMEFAISLLFLCCPLGDAEGANLKVYQRCFRTWKVPTLNVRLV